MTGHLIPTNPTQNFNTAITYRPEDNDLDNPIPESEDATCDDAIDHNVKTTDYLSWAIGTSNGELFKAISGLIADMNTQHSRQLSSIQASLTKEIKDLQTQVSALQATARTINQKQTPTPPTPAVKTPAPQTAKPTLTSKPTPTTNKPTKSPSNQAWSNVASAKEGEEKFTKVERKKKTNTKTPTTPPLLKPIYHPAEQRVLVRLGRPLSDDVAMQMDMLLAHVNKTLQTATGNSPEKHFIRMYTTDRYSTTITLQTSISTRGTDYEPFFPLIASALERLDVTNVEGESRWTKFLLHGIPLNTPMATIATSIQTNYPFLKLGQTPRWLCTEEQRNKPGKDGRPKQTSTVVIALVGKHTLTSLGTRTLAVCNQSCRLDIYNTYGSTSQCGKCYKFGHIATMCKEKTNTCGVCGQAHTTQQHKCPADGCRQGGNCQHIPHHCVNCNNNLHRSIDPSCPTRARIQEAARRNTLNVTPPLPQTHEPTPNQQTPIDIPPTGETRMDDAQ